MGTRSNQTSPGCTFGEFTKVDIAGGTINGNFVRTSQISSPVTSKDLAVDAEEIKRQEETPIKNPLALKRRSLVREMNWRDKTEEKEVKHPMEMRSRKSRRLKKDYYDCEEYFDYGDDLRFLFDDELPDLECRPRRKPRKKRLLLSVNKPDAILDLKCSDDISTSHKNNAKDMPTSVEDNFCRTRPNLKKASPTTADDLPCNLRKVAPAVKRAEGLRFSGSKTNGDADFKSAEGSDNHFLTILRLNEQKQKRRTLDPKIIFSTTKRPRLEKVIEQQKNCKISLFEEKMVEKSSDTREICPNNTVGVKDCLKLNCDSEKCDKINKFERISGKSASPVNVEKRKSTVLRMALRRRHSTPSLGGTRFRYEDNKKMQRTISSFSGAARREGLTNKEKSRNVVSASDWEDEAYCCEEISDSEQFVDSPDSGFSSETSCSAVTPDGESVGSLTFTPTMCDNGQREEDEKHSVSRTVPNDSGVNLNPSANKKQEILETSQKTRELRLNLCQKSAFEAQRLEQEEKQKREEEMLRERYQCRWLDCPNPFESHSGADLHSHLEKYHAENFCCKWKGCKFFDMKSRKLSFLQRHIGEHSGEKPFKCILDGCDASFSSILSRKRHVEAHYSEVTLPKARIGGDSDGFSRYLLNSRRIEDKRKTLANRHDCMDKRTLAFIRGALVRNEVALATDGRDVCSEATEITFHAEVMGERVSTNGTKSKLVKWKPEKILPDEWIPAFEFKSEKKMTKTELPFNSKVEMKRLLFFGRTDFIQKSARKASVLDLIF